MNFAQRTLQSSAKHLQTARLFKLSLLIFLAFQLMANPGFANSEESDSLSNAERRQRAIASRLEAATVFVLAFNDEGISFGSGFMVADGYILTNAHVVAEADLDSIFIINELLPLTPAQLIDLSFEDWQADDMLAPGAKDFALLKFALPPELTLPPLAFNLDVRRMDRISAWGYPGMITQFDQSMRDLLSGNATEETFQPPPVVYTEGTVSTLVKSQGEAIIHTASISQGNSGGPLINRRGEVLGINTWIYQRSNSGAVVNAALTAKDAVAFLKNNGIEVTIIDRKRMQGDEPTWAAASAPTIDPMPDTDKTPPEPASISKKETALDPRVTSREGKLLLQRAEQGDADAIVSVAAFYLEGKEDFPEDIESAISWLQKPSATQTAFGQALLGIIYLGIYDVAYHDSQKALSLLRQSASAPDADPDVQALLAQLLYTGQYLGVVFDAAESMQWAQKAARQEQPTALAILGFHYFDGIVADPDDERAFQLARQALHKDPEDSVALSLMAYIYYFSPEHQNDVAEVISLATQAAENDESMAQGLLSFIYAFDQRQQDQVLAEKWARRAAEQADPYGLTVLGWLYWEGLEMPQDPVLAWVYFNLASEQLNELPLDNGQELLAEAWSALSAKDQQRAQKIRKEIYVQWGFE